MNIFILTQGNVHKFSAQRTDAHPQNCYLTECASSVLFLSFGLRKSNK